MGKFKFKVGDILKLKYLDSRNIVSCEVLRCPFTVKHEHYSVYILKSKYPDSEELKPGAIFNLSRDDEFCYEVDYGFDDDLEAILNE